MLPRIVLQNGFPVMLCGSDIVLPVACYACYAWFQDDEMFVVVYSVPFDKIQPK